MKTDFEFGDLVFSESDNPKIIAEIGINHGGVLEIAKNMAAMAISSGAHAVKHQTHIAQFEMSAEAKEAVPGNSRESIYDIVEKSQLSADEEWELAKFTRSLGGFFFSTPFSREAVLRLNEIGVDGFKIGSGECNNFPFVEFMATQGKPVILSTGMNSVETVKTSVEILRARQVPVALMHTTNLYPTPAELLRLGGISQLIHEFPDLQVGLSDHSLSNAASIGAVALGATFIERHFTDDKNREGPDIPCSMDGEELEDLISMTRDVWLARGGYKAMLVEEEVTANFAFASVSSTRAIEIGELLTDENIWPKRPSGGHFGPADFSNLLGRRALKKIPPHVQIKSDMVQRNN